MYDHGRARALECARVTMAVRVYDHGLACRYTRAGGDGTPPLRRSVAFAGTDRRLICWIVTQVLDVCLTGLVGDLWNWNAGLVERKTGFKELVDRMGRWPGYGDLAWLWENGRPMEICQNVWGDGLCVGGRRIA